MDYRVDQGAQVVVDQRRCIHPCACRSEPCQHHGPRCTNPLHGPGPLCREHGCVACGYVIAADYEDGMLCMDCGSALDNVEYALPPLIRHGIVGVAIEEVAPARPAPPEHLPACLSDGMDWWCGSDCPVLVASRR